MIETQEIYMFNFTTINGFSGGFCARFRSLCRY